MFEIRREDVGGGGGRECSEYSGGRSIDTKSTIEGRVEVQWPFGLEPKYYVDSRRMLVGVSVVDRTRLFVDTRHVFYGASLINPLLIILIRYSFAFYSQYMWI